MKSINILAIFYTKFDLCTAIIISRVVVNVFQGKILLVVRVVLYQASHLKMVAIILMIKQMIILLTKNMLVFGK